MAGRFRSFHQAWISCVLVKSKLSASICLVCSTSRSGITAERLEMGAVKKPSKRLKGSSCPSHSLIRSFNLISLESLAPARRICFRFLAEGRKAT